MSWHIYSHEALPNPQMLGKPGYTPDAEMIRWGGVTLPYIPKQQWLALPDEFTTLKRQDWRDRQGTPVEIPIRRFKAVVDGQFSERGVVMLDHEPTTSEKKALEALSAELNMKWRKKCVQWFEDQVRDREVTGHGRTKPTPYEDECYEMLAIPKPYSVEAFRAQRQPGEDAAERIADAISKSLKQGREDAATQVADALTRPEPKPEQKVPEARR